MHVVEAFVDGETPRTKAALATLRAVTESAKVLVVLGREDEVNWLSLRNVPEVHLLEADQLNTYDVLVSRRRGLHHGGAGRVPGRARDYRGGQRMSTDR